MPESEREETKKTQFENIYVICTVGNESKERWERKKWEEEMYRKRESFK